MPRHRRTPRRRMSGRADVARRVAYLSHPIFRAYQLHGYPVYRQIVAALLRLLLPSRWCG